jgi:membrane protease YdiL (CAAX protease family)
MLLSPASRLDDPQQPAMALVGQALFWALAAAVVASVLFWEKQPLRSLWLQPFRWQSIGWGLVLVAVYYTILFPLGEWVRRAAGLPGFGVGMDQVMKFPLWYRLVAVVGAGISEEILFRGFSVTRFAMLTGRLWLGAVIAVVGFYALHVHNPRALHTLPSLAIGRYCIAVPRQRGRQAGSSSEGHRRPR